jgi:hypothetical protein
MIATEEFNCTKASGVDEQTFRRWAWDFVERVAELESVMESSSLSLFCHVLAALHLLTLCNLCIGRTEKATTKAMTALSLWIVLIVAIKLVEKSSLASSSKKVDFDTLLFSASRLVPLSGSMVPFLVVTTMILSVCVGLL